MSSQKHRWGRDFLLCNYFSLVPELSHVWALRWRGWAWYLFLYMWFQNFLPSNCNIACVCLRHGCAPFLLDPAEDHYLQTTNNLRYVWLILVWVCLSVCHICVIHADIWIPGWNRRVSSQSVQGWGALMYFVTDTSSFLLLSSLLTQTIPYGVLCFLPSYKMLEKLSNRWQVYNAVP